MDTFFVDSAADIEAFKMDSAVLLDALIELDDPSELLSINMSSLNYNNLKMELKQVLKSEDFETSKIKERLSAYNTNKVNVFCDAVNERRLKLIRSCLVEHNSSYGDMVTDFNWKLNLVLGTSTSNELQYPILALDMLTLGTGEHATRKNFEFTKAALGKLIQVLENKL